MAPRSNLVVEETEAVRTSRRAFLRAVGGGSLAAMLLAACGGATPAAQPTAAPAAGGESPAPTAAPAEPAAQAPATSGGAAPTTVSVWFPFPLTPLPGEDLHTFAALINTFNEQNEDVKIDVLTSNWNMEKLVTAVAGGSPPDLFYADRYIVSEWSARRFLEPLDDAYAASSVIKKEDIWPDLVSEVSYEGKAYGVPMYTDVRAFYWNKGIFGEVGLDPEQAPATWTDQMQYIKETYKANEQGQIDRLGYAPSLGNPPGFLMWYIHLWQLGGEFMNADKTQVTFNNDAGIGAMKYMLDTFEMQGGFESVNTFASALTPGPGQDTFMIGKTAMQVNGDWVPPRLKRYAPDLQWGIGSIPIPEGGQKANYNGGHAWVMPRGAKNQEAAWRLIEFMMSDESQIRAGLGENVIPGRRAAAESAAYLDGEPSEFGSMRRLYVEEFQHSKWVPTIPGVGEIIAINARVWDECMRKVSTPEQAIEAFATESQAVIDAWQEKIQQQG
jgi:ABC-type glycerol-3-phosphate transport system substrate-binding protein